MANEEHYLRLGIDAREAQTGATQYAHAAQSIVSESTRAAGAVGGVSQSILDSFTNLQRRIETQFKTAGSAFTNQIKVQLEGRRALEEEYYAATHSQREIDLRNVSLYYAEWRERFKDHQEILTLINQTEAANRDKIEKSYSEGSARKFLMTQSLMRASAGAFAVHAVGGLANAFAEAHKAMREGEAVVTTFLEKLPIVGGLIGSVVHGFENLYRELSGLNEELEKTDNLTKSLKGLGELTSDFMQRKDYLAATSDQERELLALRYKHEETLDRIRQHEKELNEINREKLSQIRQLEKARESAPEGRGAMSIGDMPGYLGKDDYSDMIKKLKEELVPIPNVTAHINQEMKLYNAEIEAIKNKPFLDITKSLKEQIDTFGMTNAEIFVYRAGIEGVNEEQLKTIQIMAEKLKSLEDEKKAQKELADANEASRKLAKEYLEKYNPVLALQREQIQLAGWVADGYIDEATYLKAMADAQKEYNDALTSPAQKGVQEKLRALEIELSLIGKTNDARERAIDLVEFEKQANEAYGKDAQKYIDMYEDRLKRLDKARDLKWIADEIGESFTNAFDKIIQGTEDVSAAFRAMGYEIIRAMMQKMIFDPMASALSSGIQALFAGPSLAGNQAAIAQSGGLSGISNSSQVSTFMMNALGNAFEHGRVMAFANGGIFDRPTVFPMRNGMGLMGEAGPEAVMPLSRGRDGRLGVSAQSQPLNIKVVNSIDSDTLSDALSTKAGERVILNIIKKNRGSIGGILG